MRIKELASIIGVTDDTVINWEMRGMNEAVAEKVQQKVDQFSMDSYSKKQM